MILNSSTSLVEALCSVFAMLCLARRMAVGFSSVGDTQKDGQRIAFSYRIPEGDHAMLLTCGLDTDGKFSLFADASDQEYQNMMVHTNEH